jgi:hypothetical protein
MQETSPAIRVSGEAAVTDHTIRDTGSERVVEAVRRALSLVGPAEHSVEPVADEQPVEESPR